uniref:hypothetical protein n=1 Tax=Merotricha bacillata TaxID=658122 RepID=UPI002114F201|nr:hypothetical protein NQZ01_pgp088 [Merotricha bacillata]UTE94566.1 hypothetical protein MbacPt_p093 [Merotricha bacillata]
MYSNVIALSKIQKYKIIKILKVILTPFYKTGKLGYKISYAIYAFFAYSLTVNELIVFIIIAVLFILTDKYSNRKVEFSKTQAQNSFERILAVLLYIPDIYQYCLFPLLFFGQRSPSLSYIINLKNISKLKPGYTLMITVEKLFNHQIAFYSIYQTCTYFIARLAILFIPKNIFYISMFLRFHFMSVNIVGFFFSVLQDIYIQSTGIKASEGRSPYLEFTEGNEKFAVAFSFLVFCFNAGILTIYMYKALRGRSFSSNKNPIDIVVRTHMSSNSLYPGEKWSDYGMDELLNGNDIEGFEGFN